MSDHHDTDTGINTMEDTDPITASPEYVEEVKEIKPLDPAKKKLLINLCLCMVASQTTR